MPPWCAVPNGSERRLSRGEEWDLVLVGFKMGEKVG